MTRWTSCQAPPRGVLGRGFAIQYAYTLDEKASSGESDPPTQCTTDVRPLIGAGGGRVLGERSGRRCRRRRSAAEMGGGGDCGDGGGGGGSRTPVAAEEAVSGFTLCSGQPRDGREWTRACSERSNSIPEHPRWLIWTVWSSYIYGECVRGEC